MKIKKSYLKSLINEVINEQKPLTLNDLLDKSNKGINIPKGKPTGKIQDFIEYYKQYDTEHAGIFPFQKPDKRKYKFNVGEKVMTPKGSGIVVCHWAGSNPKKYVVKIDNENYDSYETLPHYYEVALKKI